MRADRRARGHALVETVVAAAALVPLLLLATWLGKVLSMREATVSASRTLAFECSVRPDDCADAAAHPELVDELRRREFSRVDAPIRSADRVADDAGAAERNPLWTDRGGRALLERYSDVGARADAQSFDAGWSLATSRSPVGNAVQILSELAGPARFGLSIRGGLVAARVQADVSRGGATDFRRQLDSIALRLQARTAVLTDAWTASGPYGDSRSVHSRVAQGRQVRPLYDASVDARYALTRGFLGLMETIGLEPAAGAFRYHDEDVDVVPADRLTGAMPPRHGGGSTLDVSGW